jgi:FKBP-type peptidyl-prolyl cis-trans isomerase
MIKNIFVFIVLIIFIGAAGWLLFKKGESVSDNDFFSSPSPTATSSVSSSPAAASGKVTTMANGLKIEDIKVGTGREAKAGDTISVHYLGTLETGQKFDSSYDRNQPAAFQVGVGSLIKGWDEGIPGMKVGGKRKLIVPGDLAYGAAGIPARDAQGKVIPGQYVIPPNATLIFEVELLDVLPSPQG